MLTVYTLEQAEQWDSLVHSFQKHDVYWLSGYVKAFQLHGDGEPLLLSYDDGRTRGINVVMKRDVADDARFENLLAKGQYFDFATPYGYGGWLVEGEAPEALFAAYDAWARKKRVVCEFVRFHPLVKNHLPCQTYYTVKQLGEVVHIELSSPETIWDNFTSQNRNKIRKARKNGVTIYNGRFPGIYAEFRALYDRTMDKDEAEAYYYFGEAFYRSLLNDLPHNAQVFWAEKDGRVIAASVMLTANGFMNYHLSGSDQDFSALAPTNLLLYEAARWGYENGNRTLYLGGGVGSGEDPLLTFKRSFNRGELNHFFIGKRIFDAQKYEELVRLRPGVASDFFPLYRA